MCLVHSFAGSFKHQPEEIGRLSTNAADLIKRAFDDIDPARLIDYHTHVAGLGTGTNGTFVNPKMRTWRHPFHRTKLKVYLSAGGVTDEGRADEQMISRLVRLVGNIEGHGKYNLLAFDKYYHRDGSTYRTRANCICRDPRCCRRASPNARSFARRRDLHL